MRPSVIVLDVNETLSDLSPLAARFVEVGASASAAQVWFASVLRDGFALTAAGDSPSFGEVARTQLMVLLSQSVLNRHVEDAARHVMEGFHSLELHPDVAPAVSRMREDGLRLVTLSNGSAAIAEGLLKAADVRDHFEQLLSAEDVGPWKPDARAYRHAVQTCRAQPSEALMVAVHPWDVHGAARAGMRTAWVNRTEAPYPSVFASPTCTVESLEELADLLTDGTPTGDGPDF